MIMKFEDRLKQYRENKGWTQAELGEKSGVSSRMIQRYEAGTSRPRWDAAEKIATVGDAVKFVEEMVAEK